MAFEFPPPRFEARVLGTVDTTRLVPIDPMTNGQTAAAAAAQAMRAVLGTDPLDVYLVYRDRMTVNAARWTLPWDTAGIGMSLPEGQRSYEAGHVRVWIEATPEALYTPHRSDVANAKPWSSAIAAVAFRERFGLATREFDLGPELGRLTFTPNVIDIGWRADEVSGDGNPWQRFDYLATGISNYAVSTTHDPHFGVWMALADPLTGDPGTTWWKLSHVLDDTSLSAEARIDDPATPPVYIPPRLEPGTLSLGGWR